MEIIDTHCHAALERPVEDLLDEMNRNGVSKAVIIQSSKDDNFPYILQCKRRFPDRFSIVARVEPRQADAVEQLDNWVKQGAAGLRILSPRIRSPGEDPLAIWRKCAYLRIPVSLIGYSAEFASTKFEEFVKEMADLTIVIEHLGHMRGDPPEIPVPPYESYIKTLQRLAKYENVFMKVPGFGEFAPLSTIRKISTVNNVPPLIEMAIDAFGSRRLMWGSDFPPVAEREGYRDALRLPIEHIRWKSDDDKEWIFGKTASTVWKFT